LLSLVGIDRLSHASVKPRSGFCRLPFVQHGAQPLVLINNFTAARTLFQVPANLNGGRFVNQAASVANQSFGFNTFHI
jgi:hypothetical protein